MRKIILMMACMSLLIQAGAQNSSPIAYPPTSRDVVVDTYFGKTIEDPYRWLEADTSARTGEWVKAQNELSFGFLSKIPFREKIRERLTKLWDYPRVSAPFRKKDMLFYYRNNGLQNQSVLYCKKNQNGSEENVLLDPNLFSEDGTVSLNSVSVSPEARFLAYSVSKGGSDWNEIFIRDIGLGVDLPDKLEWVKFSGMAWYENGFYYSRYDAPKPGAALSGKNEFHKVYYHALGTPQEKDRLVYEEPENPLRNFGVSVSEDQRFVLLSITQSTHGNALKCLDQRNPSKGFVSLWAESDYEFNFVDHEGDSLFILTNYQAPRYRLIALDVKNPAPENWRVLIPETPEVLEWVSVSGDRLVAGYMKDACSQPLIYSRTGKLLGKLPLPGIGTLGGFDGVREDSKAFFTFTSFTVPGEIYQFDSETLETKLYLRPTLDFDGSNYETRQVFFTSKDGTRVPMFIIHRKGIVLNGENPTLLYGYGGFNVSLNPAFSVVRTIWLENGGIVAVANLRGGGEYGEEWHQAGTKLRKQNVFDDCIAAAEYLIANRYTSPRRLALQGGSNGGLLVGAVINQRPDLFAAALPAVGVMDMLRFHKFTIGWAWTGDYGSSENRDEFEYLLGYSPLHNIRDDKSYPAVLVTTADHDDRVVPAHSFKYIAALQHAYKGPNPVLIRVDVKAGHGAGKPTSKIIDEYTDMWSFAFFAMGFSPSY